MNKTLNICWPVAMLLLTGIRGLAAAGHLKVHGIFRSNMVLLRAKADRAMDLVNLKIRKRGGLTKIRQTRDLCVSMGIAMALEDSWGGDIATTGIQRSEDSSSSRQRWSLRFERRSATHTFFA